MKLPEIKIPAKIPLDKIKLDKKKTISFVSYAFGVTEKPGPFAALEVGNYSLKLAEVMHHEEGKRELLGYWVKEISLKEGWTETEKQKELRQYAKAFLKETPLSSRKIHLGFAGNFFYVRRLTVPDMPKEELPQALRWAARSQLPFNAESAPFAFEVLEVKEKKQETLIVAAEEDFLLQWGATIQEAGFQVASMNSSTLALLGWMREGGLPVEENPTALVDIGGRTSSLFILTNGKVSFIRDLDIGGRTIIQSLTQAIATQEGELKLEEQEAERLKRLYGFPIQGQLSAEKLTASQMVSLMRPVLERLANEIRRSFEFYREGFGGDVQKVYLAGGSSQLKNLTTFLSEKMGRSVTLLPFLTGFEWQSGRFNEEDLRQSFSFIAPVLATAFQEGKGMSLLPARFREKRTQYIERVSMRILTFLVAVSFITFFIFQRLQIHFLQGELELTRPSWSFVKQVESLEKSVEEYRSAKAKIREGHPYVLGALKEIANSLPSHAVLSRVSLYRKTSDLQIGGTIFSSSNQSVEALLGELIKGFEKSPLFKQVKLVSTQRDETYDQTANNFEIVCQMKVQ